MTDTPDDIRRRMEMAAAAMDYETARRLRDQLSLLRGGAPGEDVADVDTTGLTRQRPGRMGLGTSRQRVTPPDGWRPPSRPDPMTSDTARPRRRR